MLKSQDTIPNDAIASWRQKWMSSDQLISQDSLGASSTIRKAKSVKKIALAGISDLSTSQLLSRLIRFSEAKFVLELGTSLGINAAYMAQNPSVEKLVTIEANAQLCKRAEQTLADVMDKVEVVNEDGLKVLKNLQKTNTTVDLAFIDANHTYSATIGYFEVFKTMVHGDSILVFDDINWSPGMTRAWSKIKNDPDVTLALENFEIGVVFFNTSFARQSYVLRF